jgi:AraC-like DNA-binding protein
MTSQIAVLPLPFMTFALAALAGTLCFRHNFGPERAGFYFAAFFGVVALGSLLAGLRFGYGFDRLILAQRALPLFLGPLLFLGFASFAMPPGEDKRLKLMHLGGAAGLALLMLLTGDRAWVADWLIAVSYALYAVLLARMWRRGANGMISARLETAGRAATWAGLASAFLALSLVFDTAIAAFFAVNMSAMAVSLISAGALVMTLMLIAGMAYSAARRPAASQIRGKSSTAPGRDPATILSAAEDLMTKEALYADTGLTADRLARRLHLPVRALSEAINQNLGISVSQYVNGFRLRRAAELLSATEADIAEIMAQSGFLSRSNFYRAFQRQYGQTPVAYRKRQAAERVGQAR